MQPVYVTASAQCLPGAPVAEHRDYRMLEANYVAAGGALEHIRGGANEMLIRHIQNAHHLPPYRHAYQKSATA